MALANPQLDSFTKYLKTKFALKQDWDAVDVLGESFTYITIKEAMHHLKITDPTLFRLLAYRWQCDRSRSALAGVTYRDSSTLKRMWDRAMYIIINRLVNADLMTELEPIDILYQENQ